MVTDWGRGEELLFHRYKISLKKKKDFFLKGRITETEGEEGIDIPSAGSLPERLLQKS